MSQINLPFEVGHTIEARSFELGFRGAWFRCKVTVTTSQFLIRIDVKILISSFFFYQITKIFNKGRALFYDLEYLDFTDEGSVPQSFGFQMFRWLKTF